VEAAAAEATETAAVNDPGRQVQGWAAGGGGGMTARRKAGPADICKEMPWARSTVISLTAGLMGTLAMDPTKLRWVHSQVEADPRLGPEEKKVVKEYLRAHGPCERKRARDRLLRDTKTKALVLDVRIKTAFLGYTWRRMRRSPLLMY
jgi:hypothetical protein